MCNQRISLLEIRRRDEYIPTLSLLGPRVLPTSPTEGPHSGPRRLFTTFVTETKSVLVGTGDV